MKSHLLRIALVSSLAFSAAALAAKGKGEWLSFQTDTPMCTRASSGQPQAMATPACWKIGNHQEVPRDHSLTEFIREGDDIKNWKELVTVQNFLKTRKDDSPEEMLNKMKAVRESECPGSTEWNVLEKSNTSILYEWRAKPCLGWPEQHEIARILDGQYNRYVIHYAMKVHELAADTRTVWVAKLTAAKIVTH